MPVKSKSTLKVLLREPSKKEPMLAWQLSGYHGTEWSAAEVSWPGATAVQIIFEGEGFLHDPVNASIKNVILTTEKCGALPYFAKPGFSCGNKQFQCKNGECVKKNLRCDGDFACTDNSDEDDCECPSNKFACLDGKCLPASAVCNDINDCSNGDDENNCRNKCPFKHHCVDGSCISWSKTCLREPFCKDGTNTPSVCGSGECHLNDLACSSNNPKRPTRCESFRSFCNFESDLCQLNPDVNTTFEWTMASGETPTEKTGPSYDHSTFSKDGSFIYVEASPQRFGDVARLLSDWMEPNESTCVQFWYHMYGSDIGNLTFYLKTNQSETLVWRLSGDQGDRWKFGQFSLISDRAYRFVVEGTTLDGSEGDIAIDDLSVLDGNCDKVITQVSPDCSFREDTCEWETRGGWTLSKHAPNLDLQNYGPGVSYIFLRAEASDMYHTLLSPTISTDEWKCLRLWYFIGVTNWYKTSLQVVLQSLTTNLSTVLFFVDEVASAINYTQIPLPSNYSKAKLEFLGIYEEFGGQLLAIEQVSFSKEPCDPISWRQSDINEPLGMENGEILGSQISSSSPIDEDYTTSLGRLHLNAVVWSADTKDSSQWLQLDLRNKNIRVTGVATQGRNGRYPHWVTKYRLQYSNDGLKFQFYKDPGHTKVKVFAGNMDQDTVVHHELKLPIRARYIRFQPVAWIGQRSMRVELYGHQKECQKALGMENKIISDGQIRASSSWNGYSVASRGRLSIKASGSMRGSWTASKNDRNQWLQIDLGDNNTKVTGVATQGGQDTDQWVTSYKLQYGNDGVNFQYYKRQGEDKEFPGNNDRDTIVFHGLNPPINARYVRFRPESWQNHISMRVELYGCLDECQEALGMKNGAIPDRQISASSRWDVHHDAWQGRLDYKRQWKAGSWSSRFNDRNQWLQIDLFTPYMKVTRIATQGRNKHDQWVTRYTLWYSNDGKIFQPHKEAGEPKEKLFNGNRDQDTIVYNEINPPVKARYIRIRPQAWFGHVSMRTELYGCLEDVSGVSINISDCRQALGMENGAISDAQIIASSIWDDNHAASQARLNFKGGSKVGSWSAKTNDVQQWLQVDLGSQYAKVTRVGTQGRDDASQWVTKFKLQYGNHEARLQFYRGRGTNIDKEFDGNSDRSTIVFHELNLPIKARFFRFRPQAWFNHVSMRIELYGCKECLEPLGIEHGAITDGQLSSSSQLDNAHAAMQGRLKYNATGGSRGSWSAGNNNSSQWLQIDLLDQNNNVTRVATQGRPDTSQWVTKYKLQYSEDGETFHFYRGEGDTAEKVFDGNKDRNSVVYNELNPPITARFIRFQPVSWYSHISMRVELYGCRDDRPCDAAIDSCGWNIARGWKRMKYADLDNIYLGTDVNIGSDADEEGIIGDGNYEIHFTDSSRGYVSFSDIVPAKGGFTICFWLQTENAGFFVEYRTAASADQNETLTLGLYCGNNTFDILFGNQRSQYLMDVTDNMWHHVCVLLDTKIGLVTVLKDGHRSFKERREKAPNFELWTEGTMKIGFRETKKSDLAVLGKLNGFNIWSSPVLMEEILRMSYGCGTETGNSKSWETVRNGITGEVELKDSRTCKDRKGK
ncbi:uncharacterized protein LOC111346591 [Stylophora pistillata]|uniref:uncharacterized protein LOC111346591 n=1 Tax=Stylophora pistillata TaxID=50429 RepID=UPI000C049BFF|nr:uncharacterized protein LOC111346591 [Stylophora pistillata]